MRLFLLLFLMVYLLLLSSCKKYGPANSSFFIKSDAISVSVNQSKEGSGSHKITDLWLYVNGKYQGAYPLGSLMPIASGNESVTINIFAGIKNNGISDTRIFYPFYDFITLKDTFVEAGKIITRNFAFNYKGTTTFTWTENFNSPGAISVKKSGLDEVIETVSGTESFENTSLKVTLPPGGVVARIESSSDGFSLPTASSNVYLEIDYKSNTPFSVGLMKSDGSGFSTALVVNAQANWNKIYIQLSSAVNALIASKHKVFFEFIKTSSSAETQELYLDNIKLLYFK